MLCLVGAMCAGAIVPVVLPATRDFFNEHAEVVVPPMIMAMLLFAFIDIHFSRESTGWSHVRIPLFMVAVATAAYFAVGKIAGLCGSVHAHDFAVMAFLIGMSPTANAAPVITGLLGRREDYATVSVVSTNLFAAFALAPLTALVMGVAIEFNVSELAWKIILLIGMPFALSLIFRKFFPPAATFIRRYKRFSFYLWMVMLFTVCAQSSSYICERWEIDSLSPMLLLEIFLISAVMCAINFSAGYALGESRFRRECSQSLGQKNTMLMLWVGLAFFNPIVALGPTFYVVCHNLWNSWQLRRADKNATTIK